MPKDVLITPASGLIDFKDTSGTSDATIQLDDSGNLNITNSGGILSIGNTAANLYIGDGTNSVDIIFEQSGKIRALTNKTLTIGQSDSYISIASPTTFLSPDGTKSIMARMLNTDVLSFQGGAGELLSLSDSMSGTIYSVNDVSGIPSIEVLDTGLVKLAQYSGNVLLGTGTDNATDKLQVNGSITGTILKSSVATGTAPLTVASTTTVTNLSADLLDGSHKDTAYNSFGNGTIPIRHSSGYLYSNYFNTTADVTTTTPSHVAVQTSTDNFIRWQTPAQFKTNLSLNNVENTALSTWAGSANITTLGTIGTGTWNATTIGTAKGGTGLTSFTANGAVYATSTSALTTGTLPVASGGTGVTTSTGTGSVVLSTSPTLTTPVIGAATGTSLSVSGSLTSTVATGTAPLVVSSTTLVSNLNADLFDGNHRNVNLPDFTTWDAAKSGPVNWYNLTGGPSAGAYHYGFRTALSDVAYGGEIAIKHDADQIWFRRISSSAFQTWRELLHSGNYSSYASPLAGSASLTTTGTVTSGTWSGSFGAVSGANLTSLTAGNLTGTIPSAVLGNSTAYIGTTAVTLNRASANLALAGISSIALPGATSGTITITPAAVAGTTAITIPATAGTLVTTGDTGSVTSTMILDGTILNADINASAAIVDTKLATISTAGKVLNSATTATNANTASAIVARDASGNFSAGTITAALTGNASTSTSLTGGSAGTIPYQSAANTTAMLSAGTSGQLLVSGGAATPVWQSFDLSLHAPDSSYKKVVRVASTADLGASTFATNVLTGYSNTQSLALTTTAASTTITTTSTAGLKVGAVVSTATVQVAAGTPVAIIVSATQFTVTNRTNITTTAITGTGATATATFAAQTYAPYAVGASIVISGATPATYNGTFVVTACTTTSVSWASTETVTATVQGTIAFTIAAGTSVTTAFAQTIAALAIDGVTLALNDRVLIKDQSTLGGLLAADAAKYNGIYYVSATGSTSVPWTLTRATDADAATDLDGAIVNVSVGTANYGKTYKTRFPGTSTLNTTEMYWGRFADVNSSSLANLPTTAIGVDLATDTETVMFKSGNVADLVTGLSIGVKTIQATAASTYTRASSLYIAGAPAASTNATITTPYSLYIAGGNSYLGAAVSLAGTADTTTAATHYFVETATDGFIRPKTLANVQTEIVTTAAVNAAAATTVGTVATGTWNATNIALGKGGTNATLTAVNGGVVYSTASAMAITAAGTAGQILASNGANAPYWVTPTPLLFPEAIYKMSVKAATTANITLSAPQTIDGVAVVAGDRVLVKNQTASAENGIYNVAAGAWTRSVDADVTTELGAAIVGIDAGTVHGGGLWTTTWKTTDTLGTTAMNWYEVVYNTGTWGINTTGSAATLTTARTLTIGSTGKTFNGSANVSWSLAEIGALPLAGGTLTGPLVVDGTTASIAVARGAGSDPYGTVAVTRDTASNYSYFGMTRSGQVGLGMGINTSNQFWIGGATAGVAGVLSGTAWMTLNAAGLTAAGNVTAYSDERVKTNWRDLPTNYVEQLATVKSGIYDRTDMESTQVGVSAQSLRPVLNNAVLEDSDGNLSVAYGNAALVSAVELAKEVVGLKAEVAELKSLVYKLLENQ